MKEIKITVIFILLLTSYLQVMNAQNVQSNNLKKQENQKMKDQSEIYFAGGCFWGTEHFLKQIGGVESTLVGYANGNIANPTYEQVCSGNTNFAETVKVTYDPRKVRLPLLIDLYFKTIDPTSVNRQGNDHGSQYRTGIYYTDPADLPVIQSAVKTLAEKYSKPLAVESNPSPISIKRKITIRTIWINIREDIVTSTHPCSIWPKKQTALKQQLTPFTKNRMKPHYVLPLPASNMP